jgi:small subunit ribosomal protein S20
MPTGVAVKVKKKKKSVLKRIRVTQRRTEINQANRTRVRTAIKRFRALVAAGDVAAAQKLLSPTMSEIDRAISKGVLHENTANRYKSRLALAYNALGAK